MSGLRKSGTRLNIDLPSVGSAGQVGSYGGAASAAGSIADAYSTLSENSVDAGEIFGYGMKLRAEEQAAAWNAEATVEAAGIEAYTMAMIADKQREQQRKSDKKAKEASMWQAGAGIFSAGIGLLSSDERMKHSIERLDDVTLMLRELNPVSFYYKDEYTEDPSRKYYGFIAQEYKDVMPDATYTDSDSGMYKIDMNQLIALLVKGYQQLDNRVTRMEAKNVLAGVS